jgi:hypothetical protein
VGKGSGKSCKVKLDIMPTTNNTITISRSSVEVLEKGQEELPYSEKQYVEDEEIEECHLVEPESGKSKAINYVEESYKYFTDLPPENRKEEKEFILKYGKEAGDTIKWHILGEMEQITVCPMETNEELKATEVLKKDIPWNADPSKYDYSKILLEHFFPALEWKAKILDKPVLLQSLEGNC